jgi:hypothetical protein
VTFKVPRNASTDASWAIRPTSSLSYPWVPFFFILFYFVFFYFILFSFSGCLKSVREETLSEGESFLTAVVMESERKSSICWGILGVYYSFAGKEAEAKDAFNMAVQVLMLLFVLIVVVIIISFFLSFFLLPLLLFHALFLPQLRKGQIGVSEVPTRLGAGGPSSSSKASSHVPISPVANVQSVFSSFQGGKEKGENVAYSLEGKVSDGPDTIRPLRNMGVGACGC